MRSILSVLPLLLCAACAASDADRESADRRPVEISLRNAGATPVECRLMFGHWVDRDLGELLPEDEIVIRAEQQGDGGLFVMRPDGGARMMIETIQCGIYPDWPASVGQVDFAPARQRPVREIMASCGEPVGGGRIACPPITMAGPE